MRSPQIRGNSITIVAGARRLIHCYARMLRIWECSASYISVSFDGEPESDLVAGAGYEFRDGEVFKTVGFANNGGASVTLTYTLAQGRIFDDRAVISGTVVTNTVNCATKSFPSSTWSPFGNASNVDTRFNPSTSGCDHRYAVS